MTTRLNKRVLEAGFAVIETYRMWMDGEMDEGLAMDVHRDALARLRDALCEDPRCVNYMSDDDVRDYLEAT